jgi:hypothetical protein
MFVVVFRLTNSTDFLRIAKMKYLMISIAIIGATATASAFAQSAPSSGQIASGATQVASNTTSAMPDSGQWVAPYGQPVVGKTRAQVYQELVHAEQDGQIAYLDKTIYAGGD